MRADVSRGALWAGLGVVLSLAVPLAAAAVSVHADKVAPKFRNPVMAEPPPGTLVDVIADRITYDSKTKIAVATGLVQITFGPYRLTATRVVYDQAHDRFKANGSVVFREPNGNVIEADTAEFFNRFKEGFANHLRALLTNDVTITADYARRYENGVTVYERASYTACKTCVDSGHTPIWQIVAKTATHDQAAKTIYYRNARFEIAGVPVMWLPYLAYPDPSVKRRSGFLLPNFKFGDAYGFGLITPYFWALAPNYDLTFNPMLTTRQGGLGDVEWRHRLKSGSYDVHAYGIYELDPKLTSASDPWRGALTSKGNLRLNKSWSWGWDGTLVSDRTFLDNYDIDGRTMAQSQVYLTGLSGRNYFSAQALNYQTLLTAEDQDKIPSALPYLQASYTFDRPVLGGELGIDANAYSLMRTDPDTGFDLGTRQTRSVTNLHWKKQMTSAIGTVITPFANVRGDIYLTENVPGSPEPTTTEGHVLPTAGLDMRWPFIAAGKTGNSVLTPVFQIISASNEPETATAGDENAITLNFDHTNLFLDDRFSGSDRFEGGTRANAGFTYNFSGNSGRSVRLSAGESFHIAGLNSFESGSGLDGPASDLIGSIAVQPWDKLRLTYETRVEEDLSRINSQEASLGLTFDRIAGSVSYADIGAAPLYGRPKHQEQVWSDASVALGEAWSLFGGLRYDLRSDEFVEKTLGLSFDCDCMNAKLTYSESLTSKSINLSVEFRTLGAVRAGLGL